MGTSGELVGGLYGVKLGRAFFGESMFSRMTDASKVALAWLVARLKVGGFTLLDCQFMTAHLASLGAVNVSRRAYVALLSAALGGAGDGAGGSCRRRSDRASEGSVAVVAAGSSRSSPPDLLALDRLLEATGAAGLGGCRGICHRAALGPDVVDRDARRR